MRARTGEHDEEAGRTDGDHTGREPVEPVEQVHRVHEHEHDHDAQDEVARGVRRHDPRDRQADPDLDDEAKHGGEVGRVVGDSEQRTRARAGRATTAGAHATGPASATQHGHPPEIRNRPGVDLQRARLVDDTQTRGEPCGRDGVAITATTNATIRAIRATLGRRRGAPRRGHRSEPAAFVRLHGRKVADRGDDPRGCCTPSLELLDRRLHEPGPDAAARRDRRRPPVARTSPRPLRRRRRPAVP